MVLPLNFDVCPIRLDRSPTRPPEFHRGDIELWLLVFDRFLDEAGMVADKRRFNRLVCALPPDILDSVKDLVKNPPSVDAYDALKAALAKRHAVSEHEKVSKLQGLTMGDRKPSEFLRHMEELTGLSAKASPFLRSFWIQHLPVGIQALAAMYVNSQEFDQALPAIDNAALYAPPSVQASRCGLPGTSQRSTDSFDDAPVTQRQFNQLLHKLESISLGRKDSRHPNRPTYRGRSRSHSQSGSRKQGSGSRSPSPSSGVCFYHERFGEKARNCTPPCTFNRAQVN